MFHGQRDLLIDHDRHRGGDVTSLYFTRSSSLPLVFNLAGFVGLEVARSPLSLPCCKYSGDPPRAPRGPPCARVTRTRLT
jgi:hypothetical protein